MSVLRQGPASSIKNHRFCYRLSYQIRVDDTSKRITVNDVITYRREFVEAGLNSVRMRPAAKLGNDLSGVLRNIRVQGKLPDAELHGGAANSAANGFQPQSCFRPEI